MEHIKLQLNMLSLGHLSPAVITPRGLKKLLVEIESHLPEFLKLQYDPKGKIWKFYQTLNCSTVLDEARFLVIVSIPLLHKFNKFEIYDVFNMLFLMIRLLILLLHIGWRLFPLLLI